MMTGPLSIGRSSGGLSRLPGRDLGIGFGETVGGALDRKGSERDEGGPDGKHVEIQRWYAEDAGRAVEDEQERRREQQHPEQKQGNQKLTRTAGRLHGNLGALLLRPCASGRARPRRARS